MVRPPLAMIVRNASIGLPPLQPDPEPVQSSSSCSERLNSSARTNQMIASTNPVVAKAQLASHCPSFFTGVTAPCARQSWSAGLPVSAGKTVTRS